MVFPAPCFVASEDRCAYRVVEATTTLVLAESPWLGWPELRNDGILDGRW